MSYIFLLLALLFTSIPSFSQAPPIQWQKNLGGSNNDWYNTVKITPDGGSVFAGMTLSSDGDIGSNLGGPDICVFRLDPQGEIIWRKILGGSSTDSPYSLALCADEGFILAGYTSSNNGHVSGMHGVADVWVVKLDKFGNLQWQKTFGGSNLDYGNSIQQTEDGGYIVSCLTNSNDGDVGMGIHGEEDYWIIKLDPQGEIEWQKLLGGNKYEEPFAIIQTTDGGYVTAGVSFSYDGDVATTDLSPGVWVVKLNHTGDLEWQRKYGGDGHDYAKDVIQTTDGGYMVFGSAKSTGNDIPFHHGGAYDAWALKLSPDGNIEWQKALGGSDEDTGYAIEQLTNGDFIAIGATASNDGDVTGNHGSKDCWVVKLAGSGELLWQKCLGGTKLDLGQEIGLTPDGGYLFTGFAYSDDGDLNDNKGFYDFWIVKLAPESVRAYEMPEEEHLLFHPNPAVSEIYIQLPASNSSPCYVRIYDMTGREHISLSTDSAGRIDISCLPSGLYSIHKDSDGKSEAVGKLLISH